LSTPQWLENIHQAEKNTLETAITLSLTCSYIFSLCQLTTLTIHNSLSLSLQAQNLHLPQIFPTIDSSVQTDSTNFMTGTVSSEHLGSLFLVSSLIFLFIGSVRQNKLAICQLLGAHKLV